MSKVVLAGGLGNQLFQSAFALSRGEFTSLTNEFGLAKLNSLGVPEVKGFLSLDVLDKNAITKKNYLSQKTINFTIRQSANPMLGVFPRMVTTLCGSIILSASSRKVTILRISKGIGYSRFSKRKKNALYVGYFQSYKWAAISDVYDRIKELIINFSVETQKEIQRRIPRGKNVFVHIRLGDYLAENSFGIPDVSYYRSALGFLKATQDFDNILVFTDSPTLWVEYFPEEYRAKAQLFNDDGLDSASVLESFRYGDAYVIGNSTFSWWGAFLRYNPTARVVTPEPWFKVGTSPWKLIPEEWFKISAFSESRGS